MDNKDKLFKFQLITTVSTLIASVCTLILALIRLKQ